MEERDNPASNNSKFLGYDGPDLRCFEVTNAFLKNINDNTVL